MAFAEHVAGVYWLHALPGWLQGHGLPAWLPVGVLLACQRDVWLSAFWRCEAFTLCFWVGCQASAHPV